MSHAGSKWSWTSAKSAVVGVVALTAAAVGGGLVGSGSAAARSGSTTTTVVSIPKGERADLKQAHAELSKLNAALSRLEAQEKSAKSDLAAFEKDVNDGAFNRVPTSGVIPAAPDEVSAAIAKLFATHAQDYAAVSAQAAVFHAQFLATLAAAAAAYSSGVAGPP
jgi:PE family